MLMTYLCCIYLCVSYTGAAPPGELVFLRRTDGSEQFYRGWEDYKAGFGDPAGEFWLGLEELSALTAPGGYGLRVEMSPWRGEEQEARYGHFTVGTEAEGYLLQVAGYDAGSSAGDSLIYNSQSAFSAPDNDTDARCWSNCAVERRGAWWFNACTFTNPTGVYLPDRSTSRTGVTWYHAQNDWQSFKNITFTLVQN